MPASVPKSPDSCPWNIRKNIYKHPALSYPYSKPLKGRSMVAPCFRQDFVGSENLTYLCPQLPALSPQASNTYYMEFFKDMKQSAPWWLMLILQVVQAVIEYLSGSGAA